VRGGIDASRQKSRREEWGWLRPREESEEELKEVAQRREHHQGLVPRQAPLQRPFRVEVRTTHQLHVAETSLSGRLPSGDVCKLNRACTRASQATAASTTAFAPSSMVGRAGRADVGAVGETAACERVGCVWRAVGGQRLRAHVASSCAIASSASSENPVGGHQSDKPRLGLDVVLLVEVHLHVAVLVGAA
jgi:hypothetical protein